MDCLIKVTKGVEIGAEFRVNAGETILGRSPRAQVRLTHPSVSYEHALITRNGDDYYLENLSAGGTLLNNNKVTGRVKLRTKDEIALGPETTIRVESTPASSAPVNRRKMLIYLTIAMMAGFLLLILLDPLASTGDSGNWQGAFARLTPWVKQEVEANRLPAGCDELLREGWRRDTAGDRKGASQMYLKLQILLASSENRTNIADLSAQYPGALATLAAGGENAAKLTDEQMLAALNQFARLRLMATGSSKGN